MSLDCRLLRKKGEDQIYYYCRNSGVTPTEISLWTDPVETPKEEVKQIPDNHIQERYGAYIQLYGKRYN